MAKKPSARRSSSRPRRSRKVAGTRGKKPRRPGRRALSHGRAARLFRLLAALDEGPKSRNELLRRLGVGMRTFYRDLNVLEGWRIVIGLSEGKYALRQRLARCLERLPFPDPELTFSEATQLAQGRSAAHRKLRKQLDQLTK